MRFEFSAGGIVLRQVVDPRMRAQDFGSKPLSKRLNLEVLVCQHSQHHGWVFPKGLIGDQKAKSKKQKVKRETKEEAALREVKEETGVVGKILKELHPMTYWYVFSSKGRSASGRKGEKIKKTVYYFLMEYVSGDTTDHDHEMEAVEWLPIEQIADRLTYKSDKEVWKKAKQLI